MANKSSISLESTTASWPSSVQPSSALPSLDLGRSSRSNASFRMSKAVTLPQLNRSSSSLASPETSERYSSVDPLRISLGGASNFDMIRRRNFFRKALSGTSLKASRSTRSYKRCKTLRKALKSTAKLAVSRATELMDGGIVTDILLRDYIREQSQTQAVVTVWPDDLYQWYKERSQRRKRITRMLKRALVDDAEDEDTSSSDGEISDMVQGDMPACSNDPVHLASLDRLTRALEHQIFLFWRKMDSEQALPQLPGQQGKRQSIGTSAGLVQGLFGGTDRSIGAAFTSRVLEGKLKDTGNFKPMDKLRLKVYDICQQHRETTCLQAEVQQTLQDQKDSQEVPPFFLRDDQNIERSTTCGFWNLYHSDDSKLKHMLAVQNARGKASSLPAKKTRKVQDSMNKTTGFRNSVSLGPSDRQQQLQESSPQHKEMAPKLQHRVGSAERPAWTPPGHSRPHSRVSSRGSKAHTPSAKSRQSIKRQPRASVQTVAAEKPILGGLGTKVLPFTILESPPPARSESDAAGPFGSLRSWRSGSNLCSMERHARQSRTDQLYKIGQDHRAGHNTMSMFSHAMRGTAAYADLQMAVHSLRQSSSEPSLMPAPPPIPDFAKTFSSPEKLPPVLGLARHSRFSLPPGKAEVSNVAPAIRYIEVCQTTACVPRPAVLKMSQTCQISADCGEALNDTDLKAFAAMVKSLTCLKTVDLSGNVLLTDRALVHFLEELKGNPADCSLTRLSLKGCRGSGRGTVHTMVSLITDGLLKLQQLDLSGVSIPGTSWLPICNAVSSHPSLRSVHLADTGLGRAPNAQLCVTNLLVSPRIEVLDLGWNSLAPEVFKALGESVCEHRALKTIYLANCTGSRTDAGETPIAAFLEFLSSDRTLETLDISCNGIEYKCALVLEAALENHKALSELRIGQNPLGVEGMRCFLRLLSRDSCGLVHFDVDDCLCPEEVGAGDPRYNPTNPAGRYSLDLSRVFDRTILRMLYSTCEKLSISSDGAFKVMEYTLEEDEDEVTDFQHPSRRDSNGAWQIPTEGFLDFVFAMEDVYVHFDDHLKTRRGGVVGSDAIGDPYSNLQPATVGSRLEPQPEARQYLNKKLGTMRFRPSFRKVTPLLKQFCGLQGQAYEQRILLEALSRDFLLNFAHLKTLCDNYTSVSEVTSTLLHCLTGGEGQTYLALTLLLSDVDDFLIVSRNCHALLLHNIENPTGHYELNLANPADYFVAESLMLLDAWEASTAKRKGCEDLSMYGNWSSCRNCFYQHARVESLVEWRIPCSDTLILDYVTWRRPPPQAKPLDDTLWTSMMLMLYTSWGRAVDKVTALRRVSHRIYLRAIQLRELLGLFSGYLRREVIVIFILRFSDPQNTKVMRACLADHWEWTEVKRRVGTLHLFPHYQPEEYHFDLDLNIYEDRKALTFCVQIANKERPENLRNICMILPDGSRDGLAMGLSKSWENLDKVPQGGRLSFQYVCGPEDRHFETRREYGLTCGCWRVNLTSNRDIMWWRTLSEAPDVVLIFLYNCMRVFKDAKAVFVTCNTTHSGRLSRVEFEEFIPKMNWKEFVHDPSLSKLLFRYMDPDGTGDVSPEEWSSLQELWNELELSILEFFKFLDRTFSGNLEMAWEELDVHGSGAIGLQEWAEQVEFIGYHGHSTPIFHLVSEGTGWDQVITNQGWIKLKAFWDKRQELLQKILGEREGGEDSSDDDD